jgi:hypothetical protein
LAAFACLLLTAGTGAMPQQTERTIYVSAVGSNGMPVIDPPITAAELTVSEDGTAREIIGITKATEDVYFAVLFETSQCASDGREEGRRCESGDNEANAVNYLQSLRDALSGFVNVVLTAAPSSKILLMDVGGAAVVKHDFTSTVGDLEPLVRKLVTQKSEPVMNEALVQAAERIAKVPSRRRVILSINREPTTEGSASINARQVAEAVRKSGASVWGLSVRYGARQDANRDVMLKGLAANSGGLRLTLATAVPLGDYLRSVAANTIVQYAVTIKRPADAPPVKLTSVKIARAGVQPLTVQWSDK